MYAKFDIINKDMKKSFLFIAILALYTAMSFASIELSPRLFGQALFTKYETPGYSEDFTVTDFGAEIQGEFWLVNPGIFEFGLFAGVDLGAGLFKIESVEKNPYYDPINGAWGTTSVSTSEQYAQFTLGASLAPAIQVTFARMHSIAVSAGFRAAYTRMAVSNNETSSTISFFVPEFSAEAAYKLCLWENLSLTAGYKYVLPLSILKSDGKISFDTASGHRIFAGISWRVLN